MGLGGALATGMAMGTGSAIAHHAIGSIMGSGSSHGNAPAQQQQVQGAPVQYAQQAPPQQMQQAPAQQNPCQEYNFNFLSCLKDNSNNIGLCQFNMDNLMQCEKDNARFFSSM